MPAHRASASDSGFVLVGVVVFVLALTILVLSLYGLSSYESQFLQRSLDEEQAFQSAMGGIERAKFVLGISPYHLGSVAPTNPKIENVVAAIAMQDGDTTGTVKWQGTDVTIRVTAEVNGARRTVEAQFSPSTVRNYYRQLVTTLNGLVIGEHDGYVNDDHWPTVQLAGRIWDASGSDSSAWMNLLYPPVPHPLIRDAVPLPSDHDFIAARMPQADVPTVYLPTVNDCVYTLECGPGNVGYFRTPRIDPTDTYSFWSGGLEVRPVVKVSGLAVWLFPKGVRFDFGVDIRGLHGAGQGDCLVIVAEPNGSTGPYAADPNVGIWCYGGIKAEIPIILVTRGVVRIQHYNNPDGNFEDPSGSISRADDLSIYAGGASITGPSRSSGNIMTLTHVQDGELDQAVERLISFGALPNVTSNGDHLLTFRTGTWLEYPR